MSTTDWFSGTTAEKEGQCGVIVVDSLDTELMKEHTHRRVLSKIPGFYCSLGTVQYTAVVSVCFPRDVIKFVWRTPPPHPCLYLKHGVGLLLSILV